MKIKYTNLDIFAETKNLQKYMDYRLVNIYELSSKIFILKLTNKVEKVFIKLISGFRFHTIDDKPINCKQIPNTFIQKIRKHMNNKRMISITQYGMDRIVDFQFGENEYAYHIILEIYSTGNIILTDHEYKILSLQRRYMNEDIDISVGEIYLRETFEKLHFLNEDKVNTWINSENKNDLLHEDSPFKQLGPTFLKTYINSEKINVNKIISDYKNLNSIIEKGYQIKESYTPLKPLPEQENVKEFNTFDEMVRQFYRNVDDVFAKKTAKVQKESNKKGNKYDRAKNELTKRTKTLEKKLNRNEETGQWIYMNADGISFILDKIRDMDKNNIDNYVSNIEGTSFTKVSYNKKTNVMTIDGNDIDCSLSVYANGDKYFTTKKKINVKYQKTVNEGTKAVEKLKSKQMKDEKKQERENIYDYEERTFWFQNYSWYIMDNYLIICGKTATQNEELVKKYMNKNDIYLHGDFHGSASTLVKSLQKNIGNVPLNVLLRAGDFLVCMSPNWKVGRAENSYYVSSEQVSKTAPSGEYINKGSFMIRGKKNYLPESKLELGVGILFVNGIGEETKFISNPEKLDNELFKTAIPTIGPYIDMKNKYKYVAKLKPGRQKQGKIINGILSQFMGNNKISELERFLIKKIKNDDWCKIVKGNSYLV